MSDTTAWIDVPEARSGAEPQILSSVADLDTLRLALRWVTTQPQRETTADLGWVDDVHAPAVAALLTATHSRALEVRSTVHVRGVSAELSRTLSRAGLGAVTRQGSGGARRSGVLLLTD